MNRVRVVATFVLVVYGIGLAYALLNPSADPAIASVGGLRALLEAWDLPAAVVASTEAFANAAIFVPLPVLGTAAAGPRRLRTWVLGSCALSASVELVQLLALSDRTPSLVDVAANTTGGLLGALAVNAVAAHHRRDRVPSRARPSSAGE